MTKQNICATQIPCDSGGNPLDFVVGRNCTSIEEFEMPGEYCMVPYLRVLNGGEVLAEMCRHKVSFVLFSPPL